MSEEEAARLDLVAKHHGLSAAGLFRMLLRKEEMAIRMPMPEGTALRIFHGGIEAMFAADAKAAKKAKRAKKGGGR
jgi:hypothetical protein